MACIKDIEKPDIEKGAEKGQLIGFLHLGLLDCPFLLADW